MYVLITGGTNGIGLAAARELAKGGARIGLVARNRGKADAVAAELGGADVFEADLTSQASIRAMAKPFARSPEKGAETLVWLATAADQPAGGYYSNKKLIQPSPAAQDHQAAEHLWQTVEQQTGTAVSGP